MNGRRGFFKSLIGGVALALFVAMRDATTQRHYHLVSVEQFAIILKETDGKFIRMCRDKNDPISRKFWSFAKKLRGSENHFWLVKYRPDSVMDRIQTYNIIQKRRIVHDARQIKMPWQEYEKQYAQLS